MCVDVFPCNLKSDYVNNTTFYNKNRKVGSKCTKLDVEYYKVITDVHANLY